MATTPATIKTLKAERATGTAKEVASQIEHVTVGRPLGEPELRVSELRVTCEQDDIAVVSLLGQHDLATAPDVRKTLGSLIEECVAIVVDLSETEFIDSSVVYALVDGRVLASEHGTRIGFQLQTSSVAHRVLETCGLLNVWPTYDSRDEAIAALKHRPAPAPVLLEPAASFTSPGAVHSFRAVGRRCLRQSTAGKTRLARKPTSRLEVR